MQLEPRILDDLLSGHGHSLEASRQVVEAVAAHLDGIRQTVLSSNEGRDGSRSQVLNWLRLEQLLGALVDDLQLFFNEIRVQDDLGGCVCDVLLQWVIPILLVFFAQPGSFINYVQAPHAVALLQLIA